MSNVNNIYVVKYQKINNTYVVIHGRLPGLHGRQLPDAGRTSRTDLKIVFMTGYAENAASSNFLASGMEIISKPFNMDALARRLREMLGVVTPGN